MRHSIIVASVSLLMWLWGPDFNRAAADVGAGAGTFVAVSPLLPFPAGASVVVPFVLEDNSDQPLSYLATSPDANAGIVLNFSLYRDGTFLKPLVTTVPLPAVKSHVRTLASGGRVVDRVDISSSYGKLGRGTYELRARYDIPVHSWMVKELGLTPMSFRRTIAYLEIEGAAKVIEQRPGANEARETSPAWTETQDGPVAVAPLLRFPPDASIVVPTVFENISREPIRYLTRSPDVNGVTDLEFSLYKNGQRQRRVVVIEPPRAEKRLVRTLDPGKRVVDHAQVSRCYGKLQPGLYELRVRYEVRPDTWLANELGLTPMSFQRTIAFLEIE